ncbi:hypothetical protein [Streptomyces sp. HUAS TT20]|uniref:hypothetical protein n=1 Tax=Streptomyces sp. HUAS TT20 TaxID=3447509 RepID=UPI0021DA2980|nr:hypothetical protein [Streptomyces sp. HUAS 15-9]UXY31684.1 hypothetical protein N8I87_37490 [Streptomyces sp. HUAS 15-9]
MDHSENVDQDAVMRARTTLLGSGRLSLVRQVEAYRVLAEVSPLTYLPKLAQALESYGYAPEFRDRSDVRLALRAEAAATARRIDASDPNRTELLVRVLNAHQRELYEAGRRAEGFALCEEMAAAGRWGFERGQVSSPAYGHGRLAVVLAEDGRHSEAAEVCGTIARAQGSGSPNEVSFWDMVEWAAALEAAGCDDAALEVFAELVDATRDEVDAGSTSMAILAWTLVQHARMLDAAGHRAEAQGERKEVLALLTELAETGERRSWSTSLSCWVTLLAVSGRSAEPAASPTAPAPAFGSALLHWSPDIKEAYFDGLATLAQEAATLREGADAAPHRYIAEQVALHGRLAIRAAVFWESRTHRRPELLRPVFDEGVALARRLVDLAGPERGREALVRALTDRSMCLVGVKQYGAAHDDFVEVIALLD